MIFRPSDVISMPPVISEVRGRFDLWLTIYLWGRSKMTTSKFGHCPTLSQNSLYVKEMFILEDYMPSICWWTILKMCSPHPPPVRHHFWMNWKTYFLIFSECVTSHYCQNRLSRIVLLTSFVVILLILIILDILKKLKTVPKGKLFILMHLISDGRGIPPPPPP